MFRLLCLLVLAAAGCGPKTFYESESCGQVNTTRCATETRSEMCGPNGHWMPVMECDAIGPNWICDKNHPDHPCIRKAK